MLTPEDLRYLERAVELGRRGWGWVHPNPMVGCVVVRDGMVVGEGWHKVYGGPHAELVALAAAGPLAKGATCYVSLEPCRHHGRTPPCTQALLEAGIRRVIFGAADPGEKSGGGARVLREAGVEVMGPVFSTWDAWQENPAFFYLAAYPPPFVAVKLAQTLDGRIAESPDRPTAITGPEALREAHRLRCGFDGVMVGRRTVLADDPALTVRYGLACRKPPARIVLDSQARVPPTARLFHDADQVPVVVFVGLDAPEGRLGALRGAGAVIRRVPRGPEGLSLPAVLEGLEELGIRTVLCEGGGRLAGSLLRERRAARLHVFLAPFVLGEGAVPAWPAGASGEVWEGWAPGPAPVRFGRDVLVTYDRKDLCSPESSRLWAS